MRNPLPPGALAVAGGVAVLGVSSYVFLGIAARALPPASFATLSVLWVLFNVVGPGLLSPVELEVGRAVAERRARRLGTGALISRAAVVTAVLLGILLLATAVTGRVLLETLFDDSTFLLGALVFSYLGVCCAYLSRGALAGTKRFRRYSAQLAVDGAGRMIGCAVLALLAVQSPGAYGLVLGAAMLLGVLVTLPPRGDHLVAGPPAPWSELSGALAWLVTTSLLSQVLVNFGPVLVKLLSTRDEAEAAGPLLAALVLARIPLFAFVAVQSVLLPRMATLLGEGKRGEFVAGLRRLALVVALLGLAGSLTMLVVGPQLLALAFGPRFTMSAYLLTLLAAATGFYMLAMCFNHALIALRAYRAVTLGWAVGVVAMVVSTVVLPGVISQVVYGYLIGSGLAAASLALLLRRALASTSLERDPVHVADTSSPRQSRG